MVIRKHQKNNKNHYYMTRFKPCHIMDTIHSPRFKPRAIKNIWQFVNIKKTNKIIIIDTV
jgi:hypothetical protein